MPEISEINTRLAVRLLVNMVVAPPVIVFCFPLSVVLIVEIDELILPIFVLIVAICDWMLPVLPLKCPRFVGVTVCVPAVILPLTVVVPEKVLLPLIVCAPVVSTTSDESRCEFSVPVEMLFAFRFVILAVDASKVPTVIMVAFIDPVLILPPLIVVCPNAPRAVKVT